MLTLFRRHLSVRCTAARVYHGEAHKRKAQRCLLLFVVDVVVGTAVDLDAIGLLLLKQAH